MKRLIYTLVGMMLCIGAWAEEPQSLQEKINATTDGSTVQLTGDVTEDITIPEKKSITLDLNGFTLNGNRKTNTPTIKNQGTLTIKNGKVRRTGEGSASYYVIENMGTITLDEGLNVEGNASSSLIRNNAATALMTFNAGTYTQTGGFIVVKNDLGNVVINGGTFTTSDNSNVLNNWDQMTINGGTFTGCILNGAYDTDNNILTINDGTFNTNLIRTYLGNGKTTCPIEIKGGTFTNDQMKYVGTNKKESDTDVQVVVSGGTFANEVPEKYCAGGFSPTQNADGKYGVKSGSFVAQIGSVKYETLADAIKFADGKTVVLLEDITRNVAIPVGKTLTIDLNGKTISYYTTSGAITNKGNLTIDDSATGGKVLNTKNYNAIKNDGADAVLTIKNGIVESPLASTTSGTILNQFGTVNILGGEIIATKYPIYSGSSTAAGKTAVLNVSGGTLTSQTSYAAYITNGKANITGGNFNSSAELENVYLYYGGLKASVSVTNNASATFTSSPDGYLYSLAGAVYGATANETITMQKDANLVAAVTFNKDLTLDLNSHNIMSPVSALKVTAGTLTIQGEGLVKGASQNAIGTSDPYSAVWANGGNVIINGGTFDEGGVNGNGNSTIFINKAGTITINGGTFKNCANYDGKYWTLNMQQGVSASIVAKGGTYYNFDPANNTNDGYSDGNGTNYVPDGYIAIMTESGSDKIYTVTEGQWIAKIEGGIDSKFRFISLDDAITTANDASKEVTITLLADAAATIEPSSKVRIDANGKTLTLPTFVVSDGFAPTYANVINATEGTYMVTTATYNRTGAVGTQWGTVCLPFSFETAPEGYTLYTPSEIADNILTVTEVTYPVAAGTPVIFFKDNTNEVVITSKDSKIKIESTPINGSSSLDLIGTYEDTNITENLSSIYYINGDKFHQAKVNLIVPSYRAYIKNTSSSAKASVLNILVGDDVTGIDKLNNDNNTVVAIYDLNGVKMSTPKNGINMIKLANGKTVKLIIK